MPLYRVRQLVTTSMYAENPEHGYALARRALRTDWREANLEDVQDVAAWEDGAEPRGLDSGLTPAQLVVARELHTPFRGTFPPACRTCLDESLPAAWPCETAVALGADGRSPWAAPWGP